MSEEKITREEEITRREVIKKAVYLTPVILTLSAIPKYAQAASPAGPPGPT